MSQGEEEDRYTCGHSPTDILAGKVEEFTMCDILELLVRGLNPIARELYTLRWKRCGGFRRGERESAMAGYDGEKPGMTPVRIGFYVISE